MLDASNTCVKLQYRVTSSGATVVSLIFLFYRWVGVDGMAEIFEWARGGGVVVWTTLFFG